MGSDNGLVPNKFQAITWTNIDLVSIGPLEIHVIEIWLKMRHF